MAFPAGPTNGQVATVGGITYTYNSTKTAWVRTPSVGANLVANSLSITSADDSTSTTTGALQVTGGAGIQKSISVGGNGEFAGRVGIGTAAPAQNLHITDAGAPVIQLEETGISNTFVGQDGNNFFIRRGATTASTISLNVDASGNVLPGSSGTQDLGSSSLRWRNIYTNDLNLSNGIGDYTVVEGEEDLFLYNNKSGRVFKFVLIEVDPVTAPPKANE